MTKHPDPAARVLDGDREALSGEGAGNGAPLPVEGDGYRVSLDKFEGPLDLLLYLIRREEVDIYDIPIARITDQYLAEIENLAQARIDLDRPLKMFDRFVVPAQPHQRGAQVVMRFD